MRTKVWAIALAVVTILLVPTGAFAVQMPSTDRLNPFNGNTPHVYIAQAPEGATRTQFYDAVQNDGGPATFEPAFTVDRLRVNAIAFNPLDRLVYAYVQRSADVTIPDGAIVAIDGTGNYARIGTSRFLSAEGAPLLNAGDIDADGIYYLHRSDTASRSLTVERVDLTTGLSLGRADLSAKGTTGVPDFVMDSGYLIGLGADGRFVRINPVTESVDYYAAPASMPRGVYGGAWSYGNGNIGLSFNGGGIYQVAVANLATTPAFSLVSWVEGPSSYNNDGTAVPAAPVDLSIEKTAAFLNSAQHEIVYSITVTNRGQAISSGHTFADPLLADFGGVTVTDRACSVTARVLTCTSGPLAPGESRSYTFVATPLVTESGRCYDNHATVTGNELDPNSANNVGSAQVCNAPVVMVSKSVNPASGTTVAPGEVLDYSLVLRNTGLSAATISYEDVLSDVLDDGTVTSAPQASSRELTVSAIANGRFTVAGSLGAGKMVTIEYSVTVDADGERGNDQLDNFLIPAGGTPPTICVDRNALCTSNPVASVAVGKSSNPPSGSVVSDGDEVTYMLTFTNTSASANAAVAVVDYTDTLAAVLDDARVTTEPSASDSDLTVSRTGDEIRVTGTVPVGESFTVSYSVTVKTYADQGDHVLSNFVVVTGQTPPATCPAGNRLCTEHPTEETDAALAATETDGPARVAVTGGSGESIFAAAVLLIAGGLITCLVGKGRARCTGWRRARTAGSRTTISRSAGLF